MGITITALATELGVPAADIIALAGQMDDAVADSTEHGRIETADGTYADVTLTDEAADAIREHIARQ